MDLLFKIVVFLLAVWLFFLRALKGPKKPGRLPPGPSPLPILGNILDLGSKPHESLARLARTHGPVMLMKLGSRTTVVISSPAAARAVLLKNDQAFCDRTVPEALKAVDHHRHSVAFLPVDNQWRKLRKLCREKMFSPQRLEATQGLRTEKIQKLLEYVGRCSAAGEAVDIGKAAFVTSLNLMAASLFSSEVAEYGGESCLEFKGLIDGIMQEVGKPNLADFFPILRLMDPHRIFRNMSVYFGKLCDMFGEIMELRKEKKVVRDDMLEGLLEFNQENEADKMSPDDIKHLFLDLFVAGSDTTSATVNWAMAELMKNPEKMLKLKHELNDVIRRHNQQIQESDIPKLPYLQAVVKEITRIHPVLPLMLPHKAKEEIEIDGYVIPKNTQIMVNMWAIGRDTNTWVDADKFIPERFLDLEIDYRGRNFELIPFGAGRRICVGLPLAHRMMHLVLATLVRNFDWELEGGMKAEDLNMDERCGLSVQKAIPLKVIPLQPQQ